MNSPDLSMPEENVEETLEDREGNDEASEADRKKLKMTQLAESGEISQSVKYIKEASNRVICKLYAEYEWIQQDKTNAVLADTLITKFAELMEIPSGEDLAVELREDKLLQGNIKTAVNFIAPFIPFIGLVTGGATVRKHVMKNRDATRRESKPKESLEYLANCLTRPHRILLSNVGMFSKSLSTLSK